METASIDKTLTDWLTGKIATTSRNMEPAFLRDMLTRVDFHGLSGLLYRRVSNQPAVQDELLAELRERQIAWSFWEESHARLLGQALDALHSSGIRPIIFKGTALAYGHYETPSDRVRGDTDMIVPESQYHHARDALQSIGFLPPLTARGNLISGQETFSFRDNSGIDHYIDLHLRINNSTVLANLFSYQELASRASPCTKLHPQAYTVGNADALLIACMHRLVHAGSPYYVQDTAYYDANRLIWLYDIHLLASRYLPAEWQRFLFLAKEKGLMKISAMGLLAAKDHFATEMPNSVLTALDSTTTPELPGRYLTSRPPMRWGLNMMAQRGPLQKARFLQQVCFPPPDYMRANYQHLSLQWLPWLYVFRAAKGLRKLGAAQKGRD